MNSADFSEFIISTDCADGRTGVILQRDLGPPQAFKVPILSFVLLIHL